MTPAWVVENFLPDYEKRFNDYCLEYPIDEGDDEAEFHRTNEFAWENSHEAHIELLKAQRNECFRAAEIIHEDVIMNAPIPKSLKTIK
jgi:hypothetical protein